MSDLLAYRGYSDRAQFDAEDRLFFGRIAGIEDGVGFHTDTVDALEAAFREAVEDYLETCARIGKSPERPYSGKVMLCIDPALHGRDATVAAAAHLAGKSINQFGEEALRRAAG